MSVGARSDSEVDTRAAAGSRLAGLLSLPAGPRSKYAALLAVVAIVMLASPLAGKVGDVEDNGPTARLPRSADSAFVEEQLPAFNTSGVLPAVAVFHRDGGLSDADLTAIDERAGALASYAADGEAPERVVSEDREAATLVLGIDSLDEAAFDSVADVRETARADLPSGLDVQVTGAMASFYDSVQVFDGIDTKILLASAGVVAILLLITYRSPVMWLLPLLSVGVAMTTAQAVIYLLARHAGLPVDGQSGGILPILAFGVGTDYALLLVARYREELHHHRDRHLAMALAMRRTTPAIAASAVTVVLGLSCLMLADVNSTRSLGAVCAVGVACAALAMMTVLPMILTLLGRWVFWPVVPKPEAAGEESGEPATTFRSSRAWSAVAGLVGRAPRQVWGLTGAALALLAVAATTLDFDATAEESYRDAPESVTGQVALSEHFPAGASAPTQVVASAAAEKEVRAAVEAVPGVEGVVGSTPAPAGDRVLLTVVLDDVPDSEAAEDTVAAVRDALTELPQADAIVGGTTAQRVDVAAASSRDMKLVTGAVLAVALVVLLLLLRAVVASLVLIGSVLLSYLAALGAGGLVMRALGFDTLDVTLPLLAFVFLVALGVDYTIFLMSRVSEEVGRHGARDGTLRGLVVTGGVITSAGLVLAATFGVLVTMPSTGMIGLGVIVAIGIALDTFVVRSLLVPALAVDLGRRFWLPRRDIAP
jgi:RND superfamily putative drug exporter